MAATLRELLVERARASGDAPLLLSPDRPAWSYAKLDRGLEHAGDALAALGYGQGRRVALALPNDRDAAAALFAASTWCTAAPLDPRIDEAHAARLFAAMHIDALIVPPDGRDAAVARAARAAGIALLAMTPAADDDVALFHLSTDAPRARVVPRPPTADDITLLVPTSGTTGTPRVVAMAHSVIAGISAHSWIAADDRCVCLSPLHTNSGYGSTVTIPLKAGASSVVVPGYDERAFVAWLDRFLPTYFTASPTVHAAIADAIERRGARLPASLRFVRSSSNGLSGELQARLERLFGVPVVQGYGSTEGGLIAQDSPTRRKWGTVGRPVIEMRIVDDDGDEVTPGSAGEILVRGPTVVHGYENDEAATRGSFRDGWFRTGDLGRVDDEGYLSITGRLKETINRGGLKVAPAEVDAVLLGHRDVLDAAAVGVPHRSLGEDVVAAVVLKPGATVDGDTLRRHAFARLAPHQAPSRVVILDALPRGALGKVRRAELASLLEAHLHATFVAPRDDDERRVADAFADVLKLASVGVHDHFFDLGGDSLTAAQVVARLAASSGVSLGGAALFEAPTVAQLARALAERRTRSLAEPALVRRERRAVP